MSAAHCKSLTCWKRISKLTALPLRTAGSCTKPFRSSGTTSAVNRAFVPNYGDRHRHGEAISTAFVESAVNQVVSKRMVKQQQMRWTQQGAHLLLQIRTQALNGDLRGNFCRWYPGMERDSWNQDGMAAVA
jgi:hypothetical protein